MSEVRVNKISPRSGTTVTLGDSGDTITITSGASISGFTSTGIDDNATSTAVTIDSSGNVFIGKTSSSDSAGIELLANGTIDLQASNSLLAYFNRTGSDGTLVEFHRSGVVKGLISSRSGFIDIGNDDAGLRFEGSNNAINPRNPTTGDNSDNSLDLGKSASRFKDLYLGGGLYVGGTAAANKLDDYEEGTWTPTLTGGGGSAGSHAYNVQWGAYVKIGHLVVLTGFVSLTNKGSYSGSVFLGNFPFTVAGGDRYYSGTTFYNANLTLPSDNYGAGAYPTPGNTYAQMFSQNNSGSSNLDWSAINNSAQIGAFTIAYFTNA
jgi:hypothetical protein